MLLEFLYPQGPLVAVTRSAQVGINKGDSAPINFALSPLAEQHRIVAKVDEPMSLCDRLEASLTETVSNKSRLSDSLLTEASKPE